MKKLWNESGPMVLVISAFVCGRLITVIQHSLGQYPAVLFALVTMIPLGWLAANFAKE